jgi:hypothetical protein
MQNEFQNRLKALSGQSFPPFCLGEVLTAITEFDEPIQTSLDLDTLVQPACQREDYHFLGGGGDSEGMDLSSRPPSPLTPLESEEEPPPYTLTVDSYEVDVSSRPPSPLTPLESEEELAGVPGSDEDGSPAGKFWPTRTRTRQYPHPYLRVWDSRRYGCGFPPLPWVCKQIAGLYYGSVFTTWADSTLSCSTSLTLILGPKNNVIIK